MNNRNQALLGIAVSVAFFVIAVGGGLAFYLGNPSNTTPAPVQVSRSRPVTDVECGQTYEFVHIERFRVNGHVAVNFDFGGKDRNRQPQYIWDRSVIGQSTEIWKARRVVPSLKYSTVTFVCMNDPVLEGHKASNIEVMRYKLTLRRPLRLQIVIRQGGTPRS